MPWRVVIGGDQKRWGDPKFFNLEPATGEWVEAPDEVVPYYKAQRFEKESDAAAQARFLRGYGLVSATQLVDGDA